MFRHVADIELVEPKIARPGALIVAPDTVPVDQGLLRGRRGGGLRRRRGRARFCL